MTVICAHSKGYILKYMPEHEYSNSMGFVPVHRLVMEKHIGRTIDPTKEDVHHADGNVTNNDIFNLRLLTKKEHRRVHAGWKIVNGEWWKTCSGCGRFLNVKDNFYHRRSSHNEFVSKCKKCMVKISSEKTKKYVAMKEQTITCIVCGSVFLASRFSRANHCSIRCSWVTRKGGK